MVTLGGGAVSYGRGTHVIRDADDMRGASRGGHLRQSEQRCREKRFRGGLVFKAHRLCVSLNSRLESNKEEEEMQGDGHPRQSGQMRKES